MLTSYIFTVQSSKPGNYKPPSNFISRSTYAFIWPRSQSKITRSIYCSCLLNSLYLASYFVECLSLWVCLLISPPVRSDQTIPALLSPSIRWNTKPIRCVTCYADSDRLGKVVSARFFHGKVTIFPFAINKHLIWKYFEIM